MGAAKKRIIYLIQGQASLVEKLFYLKKRSNVNVIYLTYDRRISGALYRPDTTWAKGRNILLEAADDLIWDYCIFCDDDFGFVKGGHKVFEEELLTHQPAIAVPVFIPKTVHTVFGVGKGYGVGFFIPFFKYQVCRFADCQFIAFHRSVIMDRLVVPLQSQFDSVSIWFTSSTQQLLMFNIYKNKVLQFNTVLIRNLEHRDYNKNNTFGKLQADWFKEQFLNPIRDPRYTICNLFSIEGLRKWHKRSHKMTFRKRYGQFVYQFISTIISTVLYKPQSEHHLNEKTLSRILKPDSELMSQYLARKR